MLCSAKSRGGLTTGRGMGESMIFTWLQRCADVLHAMNELTGLAHRTSDHMQNLNRDSADFQKIVAFFRKHCPFPDRPDLKSM